MCALLLCLTCIAPAAFAQTFATQGLTIDEPEMTPERAESIFEGWLDPMPAVPLPPGVQTYFTPKDDIENVILYYLKQAKREILISQFAVTSQRLASELVDAFVRRGVMVAGILDADPYGNGQGYQTPEYFLINGLPMLLSKHEGYNNNKYIIIDREIVITGSYDWTQLAARGNFENIIVLQEPAIAASYYNAWLSHAKKSDVPVDLIENLKARRLIK